MHDTSDLLLRPKISYYIYPATAIIISSLPVWFINVMSYLWNRITVCLWSIVVNNKWSLIMARSTSANRPPSHWQRRDVSPKILQYNRSIFQIECSLYCGWNDMKCGRPSQHLKRGCFNFPPPRRWCVWASSWVGRSGKADKVEIFMVIFCK